MDHEIRITKKAARNGDISHRIISVRMKECTIARLDDLAGQTNRTRNELVNLLLEGALKNLSVAEED